MRSRTSGLGCWSGCNTYMYMYVTNFVENSQSLHFLDFRKTAVQSITIISHVSLSTSTRVGMLCIARREDGIASPSYSHQNLEIEQ